MFVADHTVHSFRFEDDGGDHDDGDDGSSSQAEHLMINPAVDACIGGSSGITGLKAAQCPALCEGCPGAAP